MVLLGSLLNQFESGLVHLNVFLNIHVLFFVSQHSNSMKFDS